MPSRHFTWTLLLCLPMAAACPPYRQAVDGGLENHSPKTPRPTEHLLDEDAEKRNDAERRAWLEHMHRTPPDVDWRAIERANARADQERRNMLGMAQAAPGPQNWTEVGSSNLAGRMHAAVLAPDGQSLYGGSALGGVWKGNVDGTGWQPVGNNLWGGAHDLAALSGEQPGEPDVLVAATDGGLVHVSRDQGLTWEEPTGTANLWAVRGLGVLADPANTILVHARGPSTAYGWSILASTDYGRTFQIRWQSTSAWDGWMWVPRTGAGAVNKVYVLNAGQIRISSDGGFTFPTVVPIATGTSAGVLAGSEAGAPTLYAALQVSGQWKLYRSDDAGSSWTLRYTIDDFWQTLTASILNPAVVAFGGVEAFRSWDGGVTFTKINLWWEYYSNPVNRLHADIPGLNVWLHPTQPGEELWFIATDGGLYVSEDSLATVSNISMLGLAVSQYYSTLSSRGRWDRVSAGSQDQGYQNGIVQHAPGTLTPLMQLISGDYGHLTSGNGRHDLVVSTYPGFILVQDEPAAPALYMVDFPPGPHAWLPPVVADPSTPGTFYFCADRLWRFDRTSSSSWASTVHSEVRFGGPGADGTYLSALAFAPSEPDRVYAVNDHGHLYHSTDHGVTWTESGGPAPPQHYFYGNAIAVHPTQALEVSVGGSGYGGAGVLRSTDGGQSWHAENSGLPQTMVYALTYATDGSGDLYAGTETGAWHWDRQSGLWENIMANTAPATIYWSVEAVNDGGTMRYGTHGRGIWDYAKAAGDRDGDGHADQADICPNNDDPAQLDSDGDGTGDACDTCAAVSNTDQSDMDGDDAGDLCDCDGLDAGVVSIPQEVGNLRWTSADSLAWDSILPQAGADTVHIVYRGTIGDFPVGISSDCSATSLQAASWSAPDIPPPGVGHWYLVHGVNACGQGTLGTWGAGQERLVPSCP